MSKDNKNSEERRIRRTPQEWWLSRGSDEQRGIVLAIGIAAIGFAIFFTIMFVIKLINL